MSSIVFLLFFISAQIKMMQLNMVFFLYSSLKNSCLSVNSLISKCFYIIMFYSNFFFFAKVVVLLLNDEKYAQNVWSRDLMYDKIFLLLSYTPEKFNVIFRTVLISFLSKKIFKITTIKLHLQLCCN